MVAVHTFLFGFVLSKPSHMSMNLVTWNVFEESRGVHNTHFKAKNQAFPCRCPKKGGEKEILRFTLFNLFKRLFVQRCALIIDH